MGFMVHVLESEDVGPLTETYRRRIGKLADHRKNTNCFQEKMGKLAKNVVIFHRLADHFFVDLIVVDTEECSRNVRQRLVVGVDVRRELMMRQRLAPI